MQESGAIKCAAVQQCLQEGHVVAWRREGAGAPHEELRALRYFERSRLEPAVGATIEAGDNAPLLLAPDQEAGNLHAERPENVFAEGAQAKRLAGPPASTDLTPSRAGTAPPILPRGADLHA